MMMKAVCVVVLGFASTIGFCSAQSMFAVPQQLPQSLSTTTAGRGFVPYNSNWMRLAQRPSSSMSAEESVQPERNDVSQRTQYAANYRYAEALPDMSNMLPPVPGITDDTLFKNVNIEALMRPYSSGDSSRIDEKPIDLPDISETREGASRVFDHAYAPSFKNQDVVSTKQINTYTNQKHFITINDRNLHRDHKLINVNTNYITNIDRVNHPSVYKSILTQIANKHKPYLYVKASKTDKINDSKPVDQPVVESVTESSVVLPPTFEQPVVQKFNYDSQPVTQWQDEVLQTQPSSTPKPYVFSPPPARHQVPSLFTQPSSEQPQNEATLIVPPHSGFKPRQKGFFAFH